MMNIFPSFIEISPLCERDFASREISVDVIERMVDDWKHNAIRLISI